MNIFGILIGGVLAIFLSEAHAQNFYRAPNLVMANPFPVIEKGGFPGPGHTKEYQGAGPVLEHLINDPQLAGTPYNGQTARKYSDWRFYALADLSADPNNAKVQFGFTADSFWNNYNGQGINIIFLRTVGTPPNVTSQILMPPLQKRPTDFFFDDSGDPLAYPCNGSAQKNIGAFTIPMLVFAGLTHVAVEAVGDNFYRC